MNSYDVVIVGAGHGGVQAASTLRRKKFIGSIAVVTDEADWPYERPPLSKGYLANETPFDKMLLQQPGFWTTRDITLHRGMRVNSIDPDMHVLRAVNGIELGYGTLIWATGGAPRRLVCTGHDLVGVHAVRTRQDVDLLREELRSAVTVVVIGGGYIGLEAAAILTKLGKAVTVVEMQDRVLARVAGEQLSRFYEVEHRNHGVTIELGAAVSCIEERDGRVSGVRLGDGRILPADIVIVGVGIIPSTQPLRAAGAAGENGVDVDTFCRTSLPSVYAIGDCAAHINRFADGRRIRLESVQNAVDQADTAVASIIGEPTPYLAVPWFWSYQYDLRLQTVGLAQGHDQVVIRGTVESRSFSLIYLRASRIIALDCINMVRDFVQGKALVDRGVSIDPLLLSNTDVPLKSLVA